MTEQAPWCDDCAHFMPYAGDGDVPSRYNPCDRGHRMRFVMPTAWGGPDNFGYVRPTCPDRARRDDVPRFGRAEPPAGEPNGDEL